MPSVGRKEKAALPQHVREQKGSGVRARVDVELGAPPTALVTAQGVPHLLISKADIARLPLDNRAAFVVTLVDGKSTVDEILDIVPLPPREALTILRQLVSLKIVEFGPPKRS
jgi:hypothetical protein